MDGRTTRKLAGADRVLRLQRGLARARRATLKVVEPKPNEIQIDIDGARALGTFSAQFAMLQRHGIARGWRAHLRRSFSTGHAHVTIRLPHARPLRERVLLAALLGSDLKREGFNYIRILTRRRVPVAFFEPR